MEPLLARVQGGVDFVSVLSFIAIVLLVTTMTLCNSEARNVLTVASSVFVAMSITALLYSKYMLMNITTFTAVALATYSSIQTFIENTTIKIET